MTSVLRHLSAEGYVAESEHPDVWPRYLAWLDSALSEARSRRVSLKVWSKDQRRTVNPERRLELLEHKYDYSLELDKLYGREFGLSVIRKTPEMKNFRATKCLFVDTSWSTTWDSVRWFTRFCEGFFAEVGVSQAEVNGVSDDYAMTGEVMSHEDEKWGFGDRDFYALRRVVDLGVYDRYLAGGASYAYWLGERLAERLPDAMPGVVTRRDHPLGVWLEIDRSSSEYLSNLALLNDWLAPIGAWDGKARASFTLDRSWLSSPNNPAPGPASPISPVPPAPGAPESSLRRPD